jgi:hypothetical protein
MAEIRLMDIEEFILLPRLWQWGGTPVSVKVDGIKKTFPGEDCSTFVGSWVLEQTGFDPASDFRGTYDTAEDANAIIQRAGGIVPLLESRIKPLGCHRVTDPRDGDIGIIVTLSGVDLTLKEIPALKFGPLWSVMAPRGAMVKKLDWTGVAWRVP